MLVVAAAAFLIAAPIAIAQTPSTPPAETPPTTSAPPPTTQPATPPAQPSTQPATPAPSATTPSASSEPQGCRTSKPAGESCACLSDTSRIGTSTANSAGQNICVRPG
jgi:hypothetical protein